MKNKKLLVVAALVLVGVGIAAYLQYMEYRDNRMVATVVQETIVRPELGLSFAYPSGEAGFSLVEPPASPETGLLQAFIMIPTAEYIEFSQATEAREAPAAMSVFVFTLPELSASTTGERPDRITRLQNWAIENTNVTSYTQALNEPEVVEVDGVKALRYRADGLYPQEIYLASYRSRVYMFVTQFNSEEDVTFAAFGNLMGTVAFD